MAELVEWSLSRYSRRLGVVGRLLHRSVMQHQWVGIDICVFDDFVRILFGDVPNLVSHAFS